jgi:hypothetical protein
MKYLNLKTLVIGLVVLAAPYHLSAQSQVDSLVNRFHGTWHGDGKTLGMNARLQLKWEPVLGNKFLRMTLRNQMSRTGGQLQVFEGHAYYQAANQMSDRGSEIKYEARWFDSRGLSFPIKAHVEGESLVSLWGSPETEQGKSVYRLLDPGKMEVEDWVKQKDGTWKEFGRFVVVRE